MELLLRRALTFAQTGARAQFVQQIKNLPGICAVMVSCVDPRISATKFLCAQPGLMFTLRNAGNFVPLPSDSPCTVEGIFELACVRNNVSNIIICGHSDCKAIQLLDSVAPTLTKGSVPSSKLTPSQKWVVANGLSSYKKYQSPTEILHFPVKDNSIPKSDLKLQLSHLKEFENLDRLSQINVVQQMANVYSHAHLVDRLRAGSLNVHGMWFQIHSGQLYLFSRSQQQFIPLTEETLPSLLKEL